MRIDKTACDKCGETLYHDINGPINSHFCNKENRMKDLIEALNICMKYDATDCINCVHDELIICTDDEKFSKEDIKRMSELSFDIGEEGGFSSYRFGSC